jgi:hypothetical protein
MEVRCYLITLFLALASYKQSHAQYRVIFSTDPRLRFQCSKKTREELQEEIRGYRRVDSAYKAIEKYFIAGNNDAFTLLCRTCGNDEIPLIMQFPRKSLPKARPATRPFIIAARTDTINLRQQLESAGYGEEYPANMVKEFPWLKREPGAQIFLLLDSTFYIDPRKYGYDITGRKFYFQFPDRVNMYPLTPDPVSGLILFNISWIMKSSRSAGQYGVVKFSFVSTDKNNGDYNAVTYVLYIMPESEKYKCRQATSIVATEVNDDDFTTILTEIIRYRYHAEVIGVTSLVKPPH